MAEIMDGKALRDKVLAEIKAKCENFNTKPHLSVILVGKNAASEIYVKNKAKAATEVGFQSEIINFDENVSQFELENTIKKLNQDPSVTGILLQLPVPKQINSNKLLELIAENKDVDGFNPTNVGKLVSNSNPWAIPCTPKGILRLLEEYKIELEGKNVVIIGRSNIVGKPLSALLTNKNATVTLAHTKTKNLAQIASGADILISATGAAGLIKKEFVKNGAIVIDVGISRNENGKTKGDVDFGEVSKVASMITPVPGGVGPMTIAMLMENTMELFEKNAKF